MASSLLRNFNRGFAATLDFIIYDGFPPAIKQAIQEVDYPPATDQIAKYVGMNPDELVIQFIKAHSELRWRNGWLKEFGYEYDDFPAQNDYRSRYFGDDEAGKDRPETTGLSG